ncbi:hypothetical protein ACH5RR_015714 [Cinchona calisaya]|uniref:Uncharacterized protein n=1 Tax=Cinchona calisaya TaxID=153742 RepID=A0ABD2ZX18_9GENT
MRSKGSKQSKLKRYIAAPTKFLAKARDFYVKSMIEFEGRMAYGSNMMMAMPLPAAPQVSHVPKHFGTSLKKTMKNDENLKELYRSICSKNDDDYSRRRSNERNDRVNVFDGMFRSYSVGIGRMGRIDEDEPCCFREEEIIMKSEILFPTCRR